jgi:hypothetical protein
LTGIFSCKRPILRMQFDHHGRSRRDAKFALRRKPSAHTPLNRPCEPICWRLWQSSEIGLTGSLSRRTSFRAQNRVNRISPDDYRRNGLFSKSCGPVSTRLTPCELTVRFHRAGNTATSSCEAYESTATSFEPCDPDSP